MGKNLFIIYFHNPWIWSADFANQTAYYLSKENYVVCLLLSEAKTIKEYLVEGTVPDFIKKVSKNLYTVTPIYIIPFRRYFIIEKTNIFLNILFIRLLIFFQNYKYEFRNRFLWIFYPGHYPFVRFFGSNYELIYDCVDFFDGNLSPFDNPLEMEKKLIRISKYFFVNSHTLFNYHLKTREAKIVPQGFRTEDFVNRSKESKLKISKDKPIIGYIGGLNHRLDYRLLFQIVKKCPEYKFIFVGPIQNLEKSDVLNIEKDRSKLLNISNVMHFTSQPKNTIRSIINIFDICIIPYDTKFEFNKYCYPMKLFEYFYCGKPVISTPIEELKRFPTLVTISSSARQWQKDIQRLVFKDWPEVYRRKQKQLADENSWENKIEIIFSYLIGSISE